MMIDIARLFLSDFNASASRQPLAWMIGHKLWYRSWHQVPAGSLPDDDETLCHLVELGFDVKSFRKSKPLAMRGWVKCADGRLYHPVVAEAALEAWLEKLNQRISSGAGNASRWKIAFDREAVEADIAHAVDLLRLINPQSRSIGKALRKASGRERPAIPSGQKNDPDGIPEDPKNHPKGQRKGKEKGQGQGTLEIDSDADASAGGEAIDPEKLMFDSGRQLLAETGIPDGKARSLLGKWKQAWGAEAVIVALGIEHDPLD